MSARPVDPRRSRIVVVGTPFYRDADLPDRPEVAENVVSLIDVFTDPGLGGFAPEHCVAAPEGAGTAEIGELLGRAAEEAKDLLLFYYSGHGLLGPRRRELYLSLAGTVRARPAFTALPYDAVRDAFLGSGARNRVVIIDSCFSGRAIGVTLGDDDVLGQLEVDGTYTLTSAPPNATALTLPGERHTAFTERLLALFRNGSADAGDMITLGTIYRHLHRRALAEGLPAPQQRGTATADLLGLVRNVRRAPVEAELPPELRHGVDSPFPRLRLAAVTELGDWLSDFDPNRAAAALPVLRRLTADDDPDVAGAAHELLDRLPTERATTGQDGSLAARAELLLHKAEWTAVRIPRGGDHAAVLDEIAAATARCDPDRAERIAATIPQDLTRALVLGKIAKQVHAHDPARANRLFDAAESALLRLSTDYWTGDAQARLAALTGSVDLDRGLRVAAAIADDSHRFRGMVDLLREVPPTDHQRFDALVRRAEQIIAANRFLPGVIWMLAGLGEAVATRDPRRAALLFTSAENVIASCDWRAVVQNSPHYRPPPDMVDKVAENNRGVTMGQLIRAVAPTDLPRAERLAATIADPGTRAYAFATVVTAALPLDRQLAHRAAAEAHAAAASLVPDEGFEASNVQRAIQAIALIDIAAAERLADTMTDNAWGLAAAAMAVAPHDPDRAQAIAARIPRTDRSSTAFAELATALADNHPHQALRVAAAIPREQDRNRALRDIAAALALHDPSQSERTADRITDPATKSRAMVLIATRWLDNT